MAQGTGDVPVETSTPDLATDALQLYGQGHNLQISSQKCLLVEVLEGSTVVLALQWIMSRAPGQDLFQTSLQAECLQMKSPSNLVLTRLVSGAARLLAGFTCIQPKKKKFPSCSTENPREHSKRRKASKVGSKRLAVNLDEALRVSRAST